jgi:hypothetical protein
MVGTRQLRLSDPAQIRKRIGEFLGKSVNVVLADNTVMFGELVAVETSGIKLRNMRCKTLSYPFNTIRELYLDTIV